MLPIRPPRRPWCLAAALLLSSVLWAPSAPRAQTPEPPEPPELLAAEGVESIDVEVVNLEVFVTDGKGRTVDGLERDDFRLFVDNSPVEVTNFYRTAGADPSAASEAMAAEERPLIGRPIPPASPSAEPLTLVLYVDHLQLTPAGRRSYLRQIRGFLSEQLAEGDQLMVVSHDQGVVVEERFTGDLDRLKATLEELWQAPAGASEYARQYRHALDQVENILITTPRERSVEGEDGGAGGGSSASSSLALALNEHSDPCQRVDRMLQVAESYGEWVASQVQRSLANLERVTQALGALPGRKAVLYLSNGLDQNPGLDFQYQVAELCPGTSFQTVGNEMGTRILDSVYDLSGLANSQNVTFYTLDASRLDSGRSAGIERGGKIEVNGRSFDLRPSAAIETQRRQSRQATLQTLALETGGLSVLHANDLSRDLQKIEESLRQYYSLGFEPAEPFPGAVHVVRLELAEPRPGYELHYRRTYVDQEPADRTAARLLATLLLGHEENPLGIEAQRGQVQVGANGVAVMPLRIQVPFASLGWLEHGEYRDARVDLVVAQKGEGDQVEMRTQTIPFRIKESLWSEVRGRSHAIELALPVAPEGADLAFAVADLIGKRTSVLSPAPPSPGS